MIPRTRGVRLGKLALLQVAFAACLASCSGGGSPSSPVLPSQASAANVSATLPSSMSPMQGGAITVPTPATGSQPVVLATPGNSSSASSATVSREPVPVTFRFALPSTQTQTALRRKQDASYSGGYTSAAFTPSISLTVTPLGGAAAGPYTGTCTSGTSGNCTVSFTAAPGPATFSGTISENGNVVSRFSQTQIVQPSSANTIAFTANPVVASVTLQLATPSIVAGTAQNIPLTVLAQDANGATIAGTAPYVDANGAPVSITLRAANAQNGGRGTASLRGALRIISPMQSNSSLEYDGNWLDHTTVTASATSSAVNMTGAVATMTTIPHAIEYSVGSSPTNIINGPDGNFWFTEATNPGYIGKISTSGTYAHYPCSPCNNPVFITLGADGNMYFSEFSGQYIDRVTTSGISTRILSTTGKRMKYIISGSDGMLWFTYDTFGAGGGIGKVSTSGSNVAFYPSASSNGIAFVLDGSLWYARYNSSTIVHLTQNGTSLPGASVGSGNPYDLIAGPDGNVWITNTALPRIHKVTPGGGVTTIGLQSGATSEGITVGPDGNIWFTEPGIHSIGFVTPTATSPQEYGPAYGIAGTAAPNEMVVGPDGNIWFTETGTNTVAKFVW